MINGTVRLRKLTRKSVLWFGKHEGLSVQQVIDLTKHTYLRWVYFNCNGVTFMDDILEEIRIPDEMRIEKPGTNSELHLKLREELSKKIPFKTKQHMKKVNRVKKEFREIKISRSSVQKKSVMQAHNLYRMSK